MELLDFYYYNLGEEPTENEKEITKKTIDYLKDNNMEDKDILNIFRITPAKSELTPDDLPEVLWQEGLIKRNTFYYHHELHITSPAPYWDVENNRIVSTKFFLEMKFKYGIEDIIKYYYKYFPLDLNLIDNKKDEGSIKYLLNKYKKIDIVEPVDFILYLIDEAVNREYNCLEIIELQKLEQFTIEHLKEKVANASVEKKNKIIWR